MPDILQGTRVLEYAQFAAGPYCGKLMADLGAEVTKIEPPGGDMARQKGPFPGDIPHPERSGLFLYLNTNKRGITLNLEDTRGRGIFRELVSDADVLVEDTSPGQMQRLGLDYETLVETNPGLIMASVTPFGQTGLYRDYKAYYLNLYHCSGLGYVTPFNIMDSDVLTREPVKEPGFWGEYDCGLLTSIAILAALCGRRFGGKGQHIDVSKQEALIHMQRTYMTAYFDDGHSTYRTDPLSFSSPPAIYRCKDGFAYITASEDSQWQGLIEFMGNPEWAKEERFSPQERAKHGVEIYEHIAPWALEHTREEIFHGVQGKGCPAAPINKLEDVAKAEYAKASGLFVDIDHPQAGRLSYVRASARFSEMPQVNTRPAPLLGQHNQEVYCGKLGYSLQELAALRQAGAI